MQNRETSWLRFNERVLEEAADKSIALFERFKFLAIFTSNLDEFFMVRVGSLTDYLLYEPDYVDPRTGLNARQQLDAIFHAVKPLYLRRDRMYQSLIKQMRESGIRHLRVSDLSEQEVKELGKYFRKEALPLLSPQIIDMSHPFPHLPNKQLHIAVRLENKKRKLFGLIAVPDALERIIPRRVGTDDGFLLLEEVILHFSDSVFSMYKTVEKNIIAVTRNADIDADEGVMDSEFDDFRQHMKRVLKRRLRLAPVRLEVQYRTGRKLLDFFVQKLSMAHEQVFHTVGPLDLSFCYRFEKYFGGERYAALKASSHVPLEPLPENVTADMMSLVAGQDVLLSHPFESITPFLALIQQAAKDASVVSIKITLYRIDIHSRLAQSLIQAAENGKEVVVLMELRARFDESNNIQWAERLEQAGCKVLYGLPGHKVHCKVCLITRKHENAIHYITQIGTGNYNERTARLYTDISLITANAGIGEDAARLFNNLLLGNLNDVYRHLLVAPNTLKPRVIQLIERETAKAAKGQPASIIIKCNALTDVEIMDKLMEASRAGVKIRMIIRGICCVMPQVHGFTENITVISIVGRFLEHSRVYCFGEGRSRVIYISSADLMTRNTDNRVEVACPILNSALRARIWEMLQIMLADNVKAWEQTSDGRYIHRAPTDGLPAVNSQSFFTANPIPPPRRRRRTHPGDKAPKSI